MTVKVFNNFLPEKHAEFLRKEILKTPSNQFTYAFQLLNSAAVIYPEDTLEGDIQQKTLLTQMQESMNRGLYTYRFKRTLEHADTCKCYFCTFTDQYLTSQSVLNFIKENSDVQNPYLFEKFISVYSSGDFLSMHKDHGRGVAFIFNFTKNWRPEYGGLLHVLQGDGTYKAYLPEFNSLYLIQLNKGEGVDHFVSEVSTLAPEPRLAISGWYNDR